MIVEKVYLHSNFHIFITTIKKINHLTNLDIARDSGISATLVGLIEQQRIGILKKTTYEKLMRALAKYPIAENTYLIYIDNNH